jgi:hypothetical protein
MTQEDAACDKLFVRQLQCSVASCSEKYYCTFFPPNTFQKSWHNVSVHKFFSKISSVSGSSAMTSTSSGMSLKQASL